MLQDGSLVSKYEFGSRASDEQIARAAKALEANGIGVLIAEDGEAARRMFFELIPEGSEVFLGASVTLEQLGIKEVVDKSGRYAALRPKMFAMDKETQAREIRKLGAAPDYAAGSVQAVTEDGQVLVASKTGSQIGPYASGAGKVVWVVGAQKIVPNLDEAFRRLHEHSVPMEEQLMQERYHTGTYIGKILIVNREMRPNRITMIIVKKEIGH
jgi:L-lactate utilization protein LutC